MVHQVRQTRPLPIVHTLLAKGGRSARTCVAHAFGIICEAKKTSGPGWTVDRSSFSLRHRNKKMSPWTGFISSIDSRSRE